VNIQNLMLAMLLQVVVTGCASNGSVPLPAKTSAADSEIVTLLYDQYNNWRGVGYREGGLSKKGIDCSGYVYLTYKDRLKQTIPRSTELLAKSGTEVSPRQIRPGDLVFFKTGWKTNHVGIYLKDGTFMHASSSRGVMISKLRNPYWSDAFWMARRY
jgi:cell wall-associated NlpC family hydrolase